jgi:formylglycine-generating enzyme required for sulfatase activity
MQKSAIIVLIILALAGTYLVTARDMNVHTTDGVTSFNLADVDSITFSESDSLQPGDERDFQLTDDVTITMVWIPSGSFEMGSPNNEQDRDNDEGPVHEVNIGYGFWMGNYEVTQEQWEAVTGNNPSNFDGDNHPVEQVSWNDIHEDFLSQIDDGFRLPSESEWEYACRAGTETRFYWGDDPDNDEIGDYAWYDSNSNNQTHDVGQKRPNAFGLYDMSGNVYEWCEDWYHNSYEGAPDDGSAWDDNGSYRVLRGGSWGNRPWNCRSASRSGSNPDGGDYLVGFRLVLVR